jgi:group I intron endonuclease
MNNIYSIYKATNSINGKVYIGFDSSWPKRKNEHLWASSRSNNNTFYNAIRKYGADNFIWEVIYQSINGEHTKNVMEKFFITEYNSYIHFNCSNGYNMTLGGEGTLGHVHSQQTKDKISKSNIGKKMPDESVSCMKETKRNRGYTKHSGQFKKGNSPWNKNKSMSEDYSDNCSLAQQKRFSDPEQFNRLAEARLKGQIANKEKARIEIVFPDNRTEVMTPSEFAEKYNFNERTIYWNLKKHGGNRITSGKLAGFILGNKS